MASRHTTYFAKEKGISLNKLMGELATIALVSHDTELHFRAMARKGNSERGLELLDKLDRAFAVKRCQLKWVYFCKKLGNYSGTL